MARTIYPVNTMVDGDTVDFPAGPGEIVTTANGVKIVGHLNMPSRVPVDASQLYARNLLAFLALIVDKEGQLRIDTADEIVKAALLTLDGAIVNPALAPEPVIVAASTG